MLLASFQFYFANFFTIFTFQPRLEFVIIGEVFKVKKSSHSKRIARQLKMQSKLAREEEEKHQQKEDTPPRRASPAPRVDPYEERDEEIRVKQSYSLLSFNIIE